MFALAISDEPRCLTGISHSGINFNLAKGTWRTFADQAELERFLGVWKQHWFGIETLKVIEVSE